MKANDLSQFRFEFLSAGHYQVTYTTASRGDYYRALITDMQLIDDTKNATWAKRKDIEWLRTVVIRNGSHYSKSGKRII